MTQEKYRKYLNIETKEIIDNHPCFMCKTKCDKPCETYMKWYEIELKRNQELINEYKNEILRLQCNIATSYIK